MPESVPDAEDVVVVTTQAKCQKENHSYFAQACGKLGAAFTSAKHAVLKTASEGKGGVVHASEVGGQICHEMKEDAQVAYGDGADFAKGCKTGVQNAATKSGEMFDDGVQKVHEMTENPNRRNSREETHITSMPE